LIKIVFTLFISGLLLGSGPCLATCGPILISYVAATKQSPKQSILVWLLFSLSRICIYLILSVSIFLLGEFLVRQNLIYIARYVYLVGGIIIILIGALTIIKDSIGVNRICSMIFRRMNPTSFSATKPLGDTEVCGVNKRLFKMQPIALGLIMGLLPCAPLLAVLSYIGLKSFAWHWCVLYSLVFGIGTLISPLTLLVLGAGFIPKILFNKPKIYRSLRLICGSIIVFFGIQLIFQARYDSIILP